MSQVVPLSCSLYSILWKPWVILPENKTGKKKHNTKAIPPETEKKQTRESRLLAGTAHKINQSHPYPPPPHTHVVLLFLELRLFKTFRLKPPSSSVDV